MTDKEKICNSETWKHIHRVNQLINAVITELLKRGEKHDQSKLTSPEVELFAEHTDKLSKTTFGSADYEESKKLLKPALDHHYANNRHHPEFFKNGVDDMNLIDLIEMLIDWKASSERHNNGNIRKSLEINGKRFDISNQLLKILENTLEIL